jgi:hypothetical protein
VRRRQLSGVLLAFGCWLLAASPALSAPTQEDVFKSIQDNVGNSGDGTRLFPFLLAGAALVILVAVVNQRRKGAAATRPKGMNHPGRLAKEVMKTVPLRPAELRQLKLLAEDAGDDPPASPLALLLCPSLLAKSIQARQARRGKFDRKVVSQVARKVGVTREMLAGHTDQPKNVRPGDRRSARFSG